MQNAWLSGEVARRRRVSPVAAGLGVVVCSLSVASSSRRSCRRLRRAARQAADVRGGVRDEAGDDEGLLRDRVPGPDRADEGVHAPVPEREVEDPPGSVRSDHAERSARLVGAESAGLMRLPQVSGLVKDHLLKNLDGYFKAYGWNRFPASQLSQVRMPASGQPRGVGLAVGDGPQLQPDRRLLQQDAGGEGRHDESADDARAARRAAREGKGRRGHADRAVQRRRDGWPAVPAAAADGRRTAHRRPINNWIFQKPGANIDTPSNLAAAQHLQQWIKAGYFNTRRQCHRLLHDDEQVPARRRAAHLRRRLGVGQPRQADARATSASS